MSHRNFIFTTNQLNLLLENLEQPDVVPTSSTQLGKSSSSSEPYISTYLNLPHYLKSCLVYCSFVTVEYHVMKEKLVQLLLAEGLIAQDGSGIEMEDIAASIVDELINQGMLEQNPLLEKVQVPFSFQQLFFHGVDRKDFVAKADDSPFRLFILHDGSESLSANLNSLKITSLFVCDSRRLSEAYMRTICKLKSLVVLDLNGEIECLPDKIGDLIHLKYLCLFLSGLKELPRTLGKLQNLQTLNFRGCSIKELPVEVLDIQQLRHLIVSKLVDDVGEIIVAKKIGEMKNLWTLCGVYAGDGIANELSKLTQLRELKVRCVAEDHASDLSAAIMKMTNLVSLSLGVEIQAFEDIVERAVFPEMNTFSPPPLIQEVTLRGQLVEMPNWLLSLQNLTKLCLYFSYLQDDLTSEIQFLPKLKHLTLWNASKAKCIGKEFCEAGGFPKLEHLTIASDVLVEWTEITDGAFPSLEFLLLRNCVSFRFFPDVSENIRTLKKLWVIPAYTDLRARLEWRENYKIRNILVVWIRSSSF